MPSGSSALKIASTAASTALTAPSTRMPRRALTSTYPFSYGWQAPMSFAMPSLLSSMSPFHSMVGSMAPLRSPWDHPFFSPNYTLSPYTLSIPHPSSLAPSSISPFRTLLPASDFDAMCGQFPHLSMPSLALSLPDTDIPEVKEFYRSVLAAHQKGETCGISVQQSTVDGNTSIVVRESALDASAWSGELLKVDTEDVSIRQEVEGKERVTWIKEKLKGARSVSGASAIPDDKRIEELPDEEEPEVEGDVADKVLAGEQAKK